MKCLIRGICFIGGVVLVAKLTQVIIDVLFDNYGKRYITTEEDV